MSDVILLFALTTVFFINSFIFFQQTNKFILEIFVSDCDDISCVTLMIYLYTFIFKLLFDKLKTSTFCNIQHHFNNTRVLQKAMHVPKL